MRDCLSMGCVYSYNPKYPNQSSSCMKDTQIPKKIISLAWRMDRSTKFKTSRRLERANSSEESMWYFKSIATIHLRLRLTWKLKLILLSWPKSSRIISKNKSRVYPLWTGNWMKKIAEKFCPVEPSLKKKTSGTSSWLTTF